jgi:hypothetical protein
VKQGHQFSALRIQPGNIGPLVEVAESARQSQVVGIGSAAVLASRDMLNMKPNESRSRLRQSAILADFTGSLAD